MNASDLIKWSVASLLLIMGGVIVWAVASPHLESIPWKSLWPLLVIATGVAIYFTPYKKAGVVIGLTGMACLLGFTIFGFDWSTMPAFLTAAWWEDTWVVVAARGAEHPWAIAAVAIGGLTLVVATVKRAIGPTGWAFKALGSLVYLVALAAFLSIAIFGVDQNIRWWNAGVDWVTGRNPAAITTAPVGQIGVWYPGQFQPRGGFQVSAAEDVGVHSCLVYDDAANRALSGQIPPGEYTLKQEKSTGAVLISAHPKVAAYYAAREEPVKIKYIRTRGVPTRC